MLVKEVKSLVFPEVKVVRYAHFNDNRGYFTEIYRNREFQTNEKLSFLKHFEIKQINVSYSKKNVVRGLHFQWNPVMEKLARTVTGSMIDLFMDMRVGSPHFGKIGAYELTSAPTDRENQWIWVPVGFAHGVIFLEDTMMEYLCAAEYTPEHETTISPLAKDIDWSLCDKELKARIDEILQADPLLSERDRNGYSLSDWKNNPDSSKLTIQK